MGQAWARNLRDCADVRTVGWMDIRPGAVGEAIEKLQLSGIAAYDDLGKALGEAGADFVAATELTPAPQLFLMVGKSLEAAGKAVEAEAQYRKALEGNAGLAEARERLNVLEQRSAATGIRKN